MSPSAMRTSRPNLCAGRAPESIRRLTVRGETFSSSAVCAIVRSLGRGRPRAASAICAVLFGAERCGRLTARPGMFPPTRHLTCRPRAARARSAERRHQLQLRSSTAPQQLVGRERSDGDRGHAPGAHLFAMVEKGSSARPRACSEPFVTGVKPPLNSMSADRDVCAPN
jgi:hypothetical protein